jgi:glutaminase
MPSDQKLPTAATPAGVDDLVNNIFFHAIEGEYRKAGKFASRVDVQKSGSTGQILQFLPHFVHQIATAVRSIPFSGFETVQQRL